MENLRTARAGGSLVYAVLGLLIAGETRTLDRRFRGRVLPAERNATDQALAWLPAARALRQLVVGNSLHDFELSGALLAVSGAWGVFVEGHGWERGMGVGTSQGYYAAPAFVRLRADRPVLY